MDACEVRLREAMVKKDFAEVIAARGECRLFGVRHDVPELCEEDYVRGLRSFISVLKGWTVESRKHLEEDWENCQTHRGSTDLVQSVILRRKEAWAVEEEMVYASVPEEDFMNLAELIDEFDEVLLENEAVLATVVGSDWYENLRRLLRNGPLGDDLLWIFTSRLSETMKEINEETYRTLPNENAWKRLREAYLDKK